MDKDIKYTISSGGETIGYWTQEEYEIWMAKIHGTHEYSEEEQRKIEKVRKRLNNISMIKNSDGSYRFIKEEENSVN